MKLGRAVEEDVAVCQDISTQIGESMLAAFPEMELVS